jgi:hypothetical protein
MFQENSEFLTTGKHYDDNDGDGELWCWWCCCFGGGGGGGGYIDDDDDDMMYDFINFVFSITSM